MGRSGPKGVPPSRRRGGHADPRSGRTSGREAEPIELPAASEIAVKMQQIAHQIDHLPAELAKAVNDEPPHPGSRSTGAEVVDVNLLHRSLKPSSAHVVTVDAYPDPERPESLVVRLDGWEGFLLVKLTRDRATLLANRLAAAVEKSSAWYGPANE